jgi:hypothetical protein
MSDLLGLIDALARTRVAAKRAGCVVLGIYGAPAGLAELVAFVGLDGVLTVEPEQEACEDRRSTEHARPVGDEPGGGVQ